MIGESKKIRQRLQSGSFGDGSDFGTFKDKERSAEKSPRDSQTKQIRILSFGGGVQTTYLLLKYPKRYDYVIFADVSNGDINHGEQDKTYHIIDNLIKPFCKKNKIKFVTVSADKSLWQHCKDEKLIPVTFPRWCTDKFKIRPIRRWIRTELKATHKNPILQDIGFSWDEVTRSRIGDGVKYLKSEYPLIDTKTTRADCISWLKENYPDFEVIKSGCWFCVFARKAEFEKLKRTNPKRWQELINMEKNNRQFPKITLKGKPLEQFIQDNHTLDDYTSCETGYCFV